MKISVSSIYTWYRSTIRNPKYRWWLIIGSLIYVVSPLDISPDFFPIVGQLDDIIIISLMLTEVSQVVVDYAKNRKSNTTDNPNISNTQTVDVNSVAVEDN